MRNFLIPSVLVTVLGLSGGAFANPTTTVGAIKSIDAKALSITLDNGIIYMLPAGFKADALKVGEKVSVLWDMKGVAHEATEVKAAS
jgi:hypothetical protein